MTVSPETRTLEPLAPRQSRAAAGIPSNVHLAHEALHPVVTIVPPFILQLNLHKVEQIRYCHLVFHEVDSKNKSLCRERERNKKC